MFFRLRKAFRHSWLTFRIVLYGKYIRSGWDGTVDYYEYEWKDLHYKLGYDYHQHRKGKE